MHLSENYLIANCGVTVARMQSVHEVSSDAQLVRAPSAQQKPEKTPSQKKFTFVACGTVTFHNRGFNDELLVEEGLEASNGKF